ncbi:MAG: hypothetical protein HY674_06485 [Chloroflexi bacterium]|nr:hypothetical protein [Chloroflexota bacterium]
MKLIHRPPAPSARLRLRFFLLLLIMTRLDLWAASTQGQTPQTITWLSPTNEVLALNAPYALSAQASSGLPVEFAIDSGPARIEGSSLLVTNFGPVLVSVRQPGNAVISPVTARRGFNVPKPIFTPCGFWPGNADDYYWTVQVVGEHAFVAEGNTGLIVIDVSNPARPMRVGGYNTGEARDVHVVGTYAYVASGRAGLAGINLSNPTNPVRVGSFDTSGFAVGVHVLGDYAFVADSDGLEVIDVSNPASPIRVGRCGGKALGVHVVDNYAYVADDWMISRIGLRLIDVSNPANPVQVDSYGTGGDVRGVQVVGKYAFLAAGGLKVIDVSNPARPIPVGHYFTNLSGRGVQVVNNYAYLVAEGSGLEVIDVSNPANPVRVGSFKTGCYSKGVQVVGNYAYVADLRCGLQVLELRFGLPQNLSFVLPSAVSMAASPLALSAIASSGLPVTFTVASGPAVLEGTNLVLTGLGQVVIRAEQAGDEHYLPVSGERTLTVIRPPPHAVSAQVHEGRVELLFEGAPNGAYTVQASSDLKGWQNIGRATADAAGRFLFIDDATPQFLQRFYRAFQVP